MIFHVGVFIWALINSVAQLFQGDGSGQASGDSGGKSGEGRSGEGTCQVGVGGYFPYGHGFCPFFSLEVDPECLKKKISEQLRITLFFCQLLNSGYCLTFFCTGQKTEEEKKTSY